MEVKCDCINKINKLYAEQKPELRNAELAMVHVLNKKTMDFESYPEIRIQYEKGKNNKKCFTNLIPSHCPFCGKAYGE